MAIYLLIIQLLVAVIALTQIYWNNFGLFQSQDSYWVHFSSVVEQIGLSFRYTFIHLLSIWTILMHYHFIYLLLEEEKRQ